MWLKSFASILIAVTYSLETGIALLLSLVLIELLLLGPPRVFNISISARSSERTPLRSLDVAGNVKLVLTQPSMKMTLLGMPTFSIVLRPRRPY